MSDVLHGGCLCGAVRYETKCVSHKIANCHCSMCRRHSGAAFLTYAAYSKKDVRFTKGTPTDYQSSADAVRSHCGVCGSPLTFVFNSDPETIWLTIGSFDHPNKVKPSENWYVADKLDWVSLDETLPQWLGAPEWLGNAKTLFYWCPRHESNVWPSP